jgi:outer membrane protein TolC
MRRITRYNSTSTLIASFLITLIVIFPVVAKSNLVKPITLAEAITLALRHNRTIESAYLNRILEKFDLTIAQDKFYPNLDLIASTTHQNRDSRLNTQVGAELAWLLPSGGQFALAWRQNSLDPWKLTEQRFSNELTLSFTQPLLKGSGVTVNKASQILAERQEQINRLNLKSTLITLVNEVIQNYRSLLVAQREMEISRLSLKRSQELLAINRALLEVGRKAKVEVIQAEVDLANQELSLRLSENALDDTRLSLLRTLDIDRHLLLEPTEPIVVKAVNLPTKQFQQIAWQNRPDYLQAHLNIANAKTQLLLAENDKRWELDVITHYQLTASSDNWIEAQRQAGQLGQGDYSVGLALRIPIGDLTPKQSILSARIALRQAEIDLQRLTEEIAIEIEDAVRNIQVAWTQVQLAQRARELTQQQLEIEMEKFRANRSTNFQVVSFQDDLISAENNEIQSQINYLNALTQLDTILGITLSRWGIDIETVRSVTLP